MNLSHQRIWVAGCALGGSGYPNARNTIEILRTINGVKVNDCAHWLPEDFHLWKLAKGSLTKKLSAVARIGLQSLFSLGRVLSRYRPGDIIYIPHPSLPTLLPLSFLPPKLRPRVFCDAYITLWDSTFQDRRIADANGRFAKYLLAAESRALKAAEAVLVDTKENATNVQNLFGLQPSHIHAIPLAIDTRIEGNGGRKNSAEKIDANSVDILFFGTFVPLQGIKVVASAAATLADDPNLRFTIIGNGQQAHEVLEILGNCPNVTWIRDWQSADQLAGHIRRADICLGVFGGPGKASRVLPFKLYMALAAGKAIITQREMGTPSHVPAVPARACAAEPGALAEAILDLSTDKYSRDMLANAARNYYVNHLSSKRLAERWQMLLAGDSQPTSDT